MSIRSKVTASTLASAISVYVFDLLDAKFGFELDPTLAALVVAILTAAVTFAAGWLKKEHVITEAQFDAFVDAPEADPEPLETPTKAPETAVEPSPAVSGQVVQADVSDVPEDIQAP